MSYATASSTGRTAWRSYRALRHVMTALLQDDTELFKQFSDNQSFRRWLTDTVFALTYSGRQTPRGM